MNGRPARPDQFNDARDAAVSLSVFVALAVFLACWVYAAAAYGWFLGISLGWIPSAFFAVVSGMFVSRSLLALPPLLLDALLAFGLIGLIVAGGFLVVEGVEFLAALLHR